MKVNSNICICECRMWWQRFYLLSFFILYLDQDVIIQMKWFQNLAGFLTFCPKMTYSSTDSKRSIVVKYQTRLFSFFISISITIIPPSSINMSTFIDRFGIENDNKSSIKHQTYFNSIKFDYYRLLFTWIW